MAEQSAGPDGERQDKLLGVLAELIAHGGPDQLLAPPVVPGEQAFSEPWQNNRAGATTLLRRLAWHAGMTEAIVVRDERRGALVTERKPETQVEAVEIRDREIAFRLSYIGNDDVAGSFAHEIGAAYAALARPEDDGPYRAADRRVIAIDADRDLERGSIATVYLGLGVIAANAAYQQYTKRSTIIAYGPTEYDVVRAGYVTVSELAYLLAVQAVVRDDAVPPRGLQPVQRDEVLEWLAVLRDRGPELRGRLGIAADAPSIAERPAIAPLERLGRDDVAEPEPARRAFRWWSHRGFLGFVLGLLLFGISAAMIVSGLTLLAASVVGGVVGHIVGRAVRVVRCSACATVVERRAGSCRKCGAVFHGDIASLAQRLEAEEPDDSESGAA